MHQNLEAQEKPVKKGKKVRKVEKDRYTSFT
jgi:hypothetical protein